MCPLFTCRLDSTIERKNVMQVSHSLLLFSMTPLMTSIQIALCNRNPKPQTLNPKPQTLMLSVILILLSALTELYSNPRP